MVTSDGPQDTTTNIEPQNLQVGVLLNSGFANILVEYLTGSMSVRVTKKHGALVQYSKSEKKQDLQHDRTKLRLLDPADPFLIHVGISDKSGQIKPTRQDKYRQVEEFLRLLAPALNGAIDAGHIPQPTPERPLSIVDLGCGSAYLTLAAHQYLRSIGIAVQVTGIDIREDSRLKNSEIAERLGISSTIEFRAEEIASSSIESADVVLALHACDTATDDALAWAVHHEAKLIFVAPCCHHDLQRQISEIPEPWQMVTRHGLMKERLADLLTDSLRTQLLKMAGYRAEAIEFVGGESTPRNLMIRAVKTGAPADPADIARYQEMVAMWKVEPALAQRLRGGH
jgi:SAM-dependent methyltransferase